MKKFISAYSLEVHSPRPSNPSGSGIPRGQRLTEGRLRGEPGNRQGAYSSPTTKSLTETPSQGKNPDDPTRKSEVENNKAFT